VKQFETFMGELNSIAGRPGYDWQAGGALTDILTDLRREGHISDALMVSACRLVHDMTRMHGSSAGVSSYSERLDSGVAPSKRSCRSDPDAFARMDRALGLLRRHERQLLATCILAKENHRGTLTDWGRQHSQYKTPKTQKAMATGAMRSLLGTIHEIYSPP
jgi:hypothetical protein